MAADLTVLMDGTPVPVYLGENTTEALRQAQAAAASAATAEAAQEAVELTAAAEGVFASTAAGLSATTNGQYFYVISGSAPDKLLKLYLNDTGSAVEQTEIVTEAQLSAATGATKIGIDATYSDNPVYISDLANNYVTFSRILKGVSAGSYHTKLSEELAALAADGKTAFGDDGEWDMPGPIDIVDDVRVQCRPHCYVQKAFDDLGMGNALLRTVNSAAEYDGQTANNWSWSGGVLRPKEFTVGAAPTTGEGVLVQALGFGWSMAKTKMRHWGKTAGSSGGAQAMIFGGGGFSLDSIDAQSFQALAGTGAFRCIWSENPEDAFDAELPAGGMARNLIGIGGDDIFQAVPLSADEGGEELPALFGKDIYDLTYADSWGWSTLARLIAVLIVRGPEANTTLLPSIIKNVTYRNVNGFGTKRCVRIENSFGASGSIIDEIMLDSCNINGSRQTLAQAEMVGIVAGDIVRTDAITPRGTIGKIRFKKSRFHHNKRSRGIYGGGFDLEMDDCYVEGDSVAGLFGGFPDVPHGYGTNVRASNCHFKVTHDEAGTAEFTASISGDTVTVTAVASGEIVAGMSVTSGATNGGTIYEQVTSTEGDGSTGGTGTYLIDIDQTVASTTMVASNIALYPVVASSFNTSLDMIDCKIEGVPDKSSTTNPSANPAGVRVNSGTFTSPRGLDVYRESGAADTYMISGGAVTGEFTASISGTTMTVTAIASGAPYVGLVIAGTGVTSGTFIRRQLTGTLNSTGTYEISTSQTVSSTTITGTRGGSIDIDKHKVGDVSEYLTGSSTSRVSRRIGSAKLTNHNFASLATGAQQTTTITVTGAAVGDRVDVWASGDLLGTRIWGVVTATDTVTLYHSNHTGSSQDLAAMNFFADVYRVSVV